MSKPTTVAMYWDAGSTSTYFALKLLRPILERTGARLVLHPYDLGHIFRLHDNIFHPGTQGDMTTCAQPGIPAMEKHARF